MTEVHCVAAPVCDDLGSVVAAVSLSVPASRFVLRRPELERATAAAVRDVTQAIIEARDYSPIALQDDPPAAALAAVKRRAC